MKEYLFKAKLDFLYYWHDGLALIDWQIINEEQKQIIEDAIHHKIPVYLGEIAGKHSEVNIDNLLYVKNDIEIIDDPEEIELFKKLHGENFGNYDLVEKILEAWDELPEEYNEGDDQ